MKLILWISLIICIYYYNNKEMARKLESINLYGWKMGLAYIGASLFTGLIIGLPILMVFELFMKIFK